MTEYKISIFEDRIEWRNLQNELHRENGPAIEHTDGAKYWYFNDIEYPEKEYWKQYRRFFFWDGKIKIVEINGKKYELQEV